MNTKKTRRATLLKGARAGSLISHGSIYFKPYWRVRNLHSTQEGSRWSCPGSLFSWTKNQGLEISGISPELLSLCPGNSRGEFVKAS